MSTMTATVEKCGAKTRSGTCGHEAGWGTDHPGTGQCKKHGGSTPNGVKSAARTIAVTMGAPIDISPHEALLTCVRITAGEVAYCTLRIQELAPEEYVGHPESYVQEVGKDGTKDITRRGTPALHVWISVRQEAMDRLARYAKMALDAGVEERRVRVAEGMATMLAPVLDAIFKELQLSPKQREAAPAILERNLVTLEGHAIDVGSNGGT